MRRRPTTNEKAIAKKLGISDAQLLGLLSVKAKRGGDYVAHHLFDKGLITHRDPSAPFYSGKDYYVLTEAGEALLARARALGY